MNQSFPLSPHASFSRFNPLPSALMRIVPANFPRCWPVGPCFVLGLSAAGRLSLVSEKAPNSSLRLGMHRRGSGPKPHITKRTPTLAHYKERFHWLVDSSGASSDLSPGICPAHTSRRLIGMQQLQQHHQSINSSGAAGPMRKHQARWLDDGLHTTQSLLTTRTARPFIPYDPSTGADGLLLSLLWLSLARPVWPSCPPETQGATT